MKWYVDRLDELRKTAPIYSICGDDCAVCPRSFYEKEKNIGL